MAREQTRYADDREVPTASPASAIPGAQNILPDDPASPAYLRIRASLQTVALLLEKNEAYLPLFVRLEHELEAEQVKRDAIARAKRYLPR